jgi:hypothetical protein
MKTCHWCKNQVYDSGDWEVGIYAYEYCDNDLYGELQTEEDNDPAEHCPGYDPIQAKCYRCGKILGDRANAIEAENFYENVPVCSEEHKQIVEQEAEDYYQQLKSELK